LTEKEERTLGNDTKTILPPARQALENLNAAIANAEAALATLRLGRAKLILNIGDVKNAEVELDAIVSRDASDIVAKVRSGVAWAIGAIGGAQVQKLAARLAASRHHTIVAERALAQTDQEISGLEARIAALHAGKPAAVAAVVREAASGLYEDYSTLVEHLREAMTHIAALERHLSVQRMGRIVATLPYFLWTDNLPECAVVAQERQVRKSQAVFARFAEALADDPSAPASMLSSTG
jgi:hypothetical protein